MGNHVSIRISITGQQLRGHSPGIGIEAFNLDGTNVVAALSVTCHVDDFPDAQLPSVLLLLQLPLNSFQR